MTIKECRNEVGRCRRNLANGGGVEFWRKRLSAAVLEAEAMAGILREELKTLPPPLADGPTKPETGGAL